ncbi:hypothetical protein J6590_008471 [Homalodisca vitripennis]|nr:hypothetical protein J6590_008471 [Homalodisca vitripennis]
MSMILQSCGISPVQYNYNYSKAVDTTPQQMYRPVTDSLKGINSISALATIKIAVRCIRTLHEFTFPGPSVILLPFLRCIFDSFPKKQKVFMKSAIQA